MTSAQSPNLRTYELNVAIVENVKKHPVLYDPTLPEYEKKIYSKEAWESVAKATNVSVETCRARWRNLWLSFLRYQRMKRDPNTQVKPYYLQQDMAFLLPYIRPRPDREGPNRRSITSRSHLKHVKHIRDYDDAPTSQQVVRFSVENEGQNIEIEYLEDGCEQQEEVIVCESMKRELNDDQAEEADQGDYMDQQQEYEISQEYAEHPHEYTVHQEYTETPDDYTETPEDYTEHTQNYVVDDHHDYTEHAEEHQVYEEQSSSGVQQSKQTKQNYYEIVSTTEEHHPTDADHDPDWDFMKSFLPDIRKMTPGQKIRFKMSLCSAIHEILYS